MTSMLFDENDPAFKDLEKTKCLDKASLSFDLPHRHPTRLSDIGEEEEKKEEGKDSTSSSGSWQDVLEFESGDDEFESGDDKVDPSVNGMLPDTERPSRRDYKDFWRASAKGNIDVLNEKLDLGVDVNRESSKGYTALVIAISETKVDAVKWLLERGANVHHRVNELPPVVHATAQLQHGPELLQLLIDHGANLNVISKPDSRSLLHCAAAIGKPDTIEFLINQGLDLEKRCRRGCTPLLVAARAGNIESAETLLRLGAKLDVVGVNGGSPLIWSSSWENDIAVRFWLEQGVDIDARDINGRTSLFQACHYGSLETVNVLLEHGADTSIVSKNPANITALMAAASSDHAEIIKTLAVHGCDLGYRNNAGETALDVAIIERRPKAIRALLELMGGQDYPQESVSLQIALANGHETVKTLMETISLLYPHITPAAFPGKHDWLPWVLLQGGDLVRPRAMFKILHVALEEQNINMVQELNLQGCSMNVVLESGHTPLSFAIGHRNLDLIRELLDMGADPNLPRVHPQDYTAFDDAIIDMETASDTEVIDLLLETGRCKINKGKNPANTAFSYVLDKADEFPRGGWKDLGIRMLESIPDVNDDKCNVGCSLLHVATLRQNEEIVDLLLKKGADLEAKDMLGVTPFILACQHAPKMISFLSKRGANMDARYKSNAGAMAAAASHGRVESLAELIERYRMDVEAQTDLGYTSLACALTWSQEEAALYLLYRGADVHFKTQPRNQTALHYAAKYNLERVVKKLLDIGVDVNAADSEGWTPLHEACALSSPKVVEMLLDAGANIEASLPNKDRPLHVALINEQQDSAALLISRGADVTVRASKSRTPLHICAEYNLLDIASHLISRGASTEDIDDETWTPLCCCGHPKFVDLLIENGANVNYADKDNWTSLHQAVHNADVDIADRLLQCGAEIDVRTTDDGLSVMERAIDLPNSADSRDMVSLLVKTMEWREFQRRMDEEMKKEREEEREELNREGLVLIVDKDDVIG